MQKDDSTSGFLMTVGDFSYGLFNQDDQWVLFDSHGHLGQFCSGKIQLISRDRGALIVSASQLDKLIKILQDTHPGYGECQVATIDIKPVTPAISDHCSGDMGDSTPQELTQQDAVETSLRKKEVVRILKLLSENIIIMRLVSKDSCKCLTFCNREAHKRLQTVQTQMICSIIMKHFIRVW